MPYGGNGFASIGVNCPNGLFSLANGFMGAEAAIALAILLCLYLFGFNKHSVFSVEDVSNITDLLKLSRKKILF
jgi:hypothetical protein